MIGKEQNCLFGRFLVCGGLGLALLAGAGVTAARYVMQNRQRSSDGGGILFHQRPLREPRRRPCTILIQRRRHFP